MLADLAGLTPDPRPGRHRRRPRLLAVKPLAGGSSFGVDVVPAEPAPLAAAVDAAFATTAGAVLVEEFLTGTEFSVVVLDGPSGPTALAPTEVEKPPASLVYGTEEKYLHGSGVIHHTPMRADDDVLHEIRRRAADAFGILGLRHMARIDGFRTDDGTVVVTDVNGIGGMGFSSFVFQQAAMVGIDHRHLILGLLGAATAGTPVTAAVGRGDGRGGPADPRGPRRSHQRAPGQPPERLLRRACRCWPPGATSASS